MHDLPSNTWRILSPLGQPVDRGPSANVATTSIHLTPGDIVTITRNGWPSWERISSKLAERFQELQLQVKFVDVPLGRATPAERMEEIAAESQLVVLGLANCGSCTVSTMQNYQALGTGTPIAIAVTERFVDLATSLAAGAPLQTLPHDIEQRSAEGWDELAERLGTQLLDSTEAQVRRAG